MTHAAAALGKHQLAREVIERPIGRVGQVDRDQIGQHAGRNRTQLVGHAG